MLENIKILLTQNQKKQYVLLFFGWIIPIIRLVFILSSIILIYLGSNMFKGTEVFGKIIKFDSGKIEILFGKFSIFFIDFYYSKLI